MFRYNDDWTGFEFDNFGKWRVLGCDGYWWICEYVTDTQRQTRFTYRGLLDIWATQAQAHIDALEARVKELEQELKDEQDFAYRHWGESL